MGFQMNILLLYSEWNHLALNALRSHCDVKFVVQNKACLTKRRQTRREGSF